LSAEVPAGAIVGLVGDDAAAQEAVLGLASGAVRAESGTVVAEGARVFDHVFARAGIAESARLRREIEGARRGGAAVLLASQDERILKSLCDEVWWLDEGRLALQAAPAEALAAYQRASMEKLAAWGRAQEQTVQPAMRRGDGRAKLVSIETLDAQDRPSAIWRSGERAGVRVRARFEGAVDDPVIGIMIRTRVGFDVFGTNTELESVNLGRKNAGEEATVTFRFVCALCPQEYTLTAASHDRDGTWHDWMEDAITFSVADTRHTAGVANLRASVEVG